MIKGVIVIMNANEGLVHVGSAPSSLFKSSGGV